MKARRLRTSSTSKIAVAHLVAAVTFVLPLAVPGRFAAFAQPGVGSDIPDEWRFRPEEDIRWRRLETILRGDDELSDQRYVLKGQAAAHLKGGPTHCNSGVMEHDPSQTRKETPFLRVLERGAVIFVGEVVDIAPGMTALEPATVVQLSVQEIWRGESRIAGQDRVFYELPSFDAALPDGGRICYAHGFPLPPEIGILALVVLGPTDDLENGWIVPGHAGSSISFLGPGSVSVMPADENDVPRELREDPEAYLEWVQQAAGEDEGR